MHHPSGAGIVAGFLAVIMSIGAHLAADWPLLQNLGYLATITAASVSIYFTIKKRKQP